VSLSLGYVMGLSPSSQRPIYWTHTSGIGPGQEISGPSLPATRRVTATAARVGEFGKQTLDAPDRNLYNTTVYNCKHS